MPRPDEFDDDRPRQQPEEPGVDLAPVDRDAQFAELQGTLADLAAAEPISITAPDWPEEGPAAPTQDVGRLFAEGTALLGSLSAAAAASQPRLPKGARRRIEAADANQAQAEFLQAEAAEPAAEDAGFPGPESLPDFEAMRRLTEEMLAANREGRFTFAGGQSRFTPATPRHEFQAEAFPEGNPQDAQAEAEAAYRSADRERWERTIRWLTEATDAIHEHSLRIDELQKRLERDRY